MTAGWLVLPLLVTAAGLLLWVLTQLAADSGDDQHQADNERPAGRSDRLPPGGAGCVSRPAASWHDRTLPAAAPTARLSAPRVSGGRVTVTNRIRYAYALADQPACQVLAAYGWPAQEVTA